MYSNSNSDNYPKSMITGQVPLPVKITRIQNDIFEPYHLTEEGYFRALVNKNHLRLLNLRKSVVEVHPIHPQNKDILQKEIRIFKLEETSLRILTSYKDLTIGRRVIRDCIAAPKDWFEAERIPEYVDPVDAIIWSIINVI